MALHALIYRHIDDPELVAVHRPEHRTCLRTLEEAGSLVVAGPLGPPGPAGGLLIFDVRCVGDVETLADNDPFHTHGVVVERTIQTWTLSIGADRLPG